MPELAIITDNPNPQSLSFAVSGAPMLQQISRVSFDNPYQPGAVDDLAAKVEAAAPVLADLMKQNTAIDRIDLFNQISGQTGQEALHVSLLFNKLVRFNDNRLGLSHLVQRIMSSLSGDTTSPEQAAFERLQGSGDWFVDESQVREHFEKIIPFDPANASVVLRRVMGNKIAKLKTDANKVLTTGDLVDKMRKDGGNLIVTEIDAAKSNGKLSLSAKLVAFGACEACPSASGEQDPNAFDGSTLGTAKALLEIACEENGYAEGTYECSVEEIDTPSAFWMPR